METLFFSINPNKQKLISGHLTQFWLVTLIALFIWYALYKLLSSQKIRRNKFKSWKTMPRKWAVLISGSIGLCIIGFVYVENWTHFFQIDVQQNNLHLHYFLPKRIVTITKGDIAELTPREKRSKTMHYRLIIKTKEGKEYTSSFIGSNLLEKNLEKIKETLMMKK